MAVSLNVNFSVVCRSFRRVSGTSKNTGRPFDFYACEVRDPVGDETYKINVPVKDGLNPPVVGAEYPLQVTIDRDYNFNMSLRFGISPDLIS